MRAAIERLGEPCAVIGTQPYVPVEGMESALGQPITWVDPARPVTWAQLGLDAPKLFIQSGWRYPAISALGRDARAHGARVVGLTDINWRGDFRQTVLGPLGFRLLHRARFDAMVVAGAQGRRVMRLFGMPDERIREGVYGADPALFTPGPPLAQRDRTFLFVGRFEPQKNVLGLVEAFQRFARTRPGWTLRLCGSGSQRGLIPNHPAIIVEDFVQPQDLPGRYHQARFFVLPSVHEPWGLVVHEAALSGCALLLSDAVGSGDDLATPANALRFRAGDVDALAAALEAAAAADERWLDGAHAQSLRLSSRFGPSRFADEIALLASRLLKDA
ncbi:MAG: glycosyltransferase family 4 protein [Beijerinckiaceae bacterium]|nr:glycosyltransferase family 4 protein [Beijerinckiaceae bacterium]